MSNSDRGTGPPQKGTAARLGDRDGGGNDTSQQNTATYSTRPTAEEIFYECVETRAYLWAVGELDLHEAVDELQEYAERTGLVDSIGQDAVQAIMAEAFGAIPNENSNAEEISEARLYAALAALPPKDRAEIAFKPDKKKTAEYIVQHMDAEQLRLWLDECCTAAERIAILNHIERKRGA